MSDKKTPKKVFVDGAISPEKIATSIAHHQVKTNIGAHDIFLGKVRADEIDGKTVQAIDYSAYEEMAEEKFHEISTEITFDYELHHDEWGHTNDRKWRHGSGNKIYDLDIVRLLEDAKDYITYNIIDKKITNGRRFIVSRMGGDNLNVVIEPYQNFIN